MLRAVLIVGAFLWSLLITQDEPGDAGDEPSPSPPASPPPPESPPTFTQKDVDKIAANRARESRQTKEKEILDKYGLSSLEDLDGIVESYKLIEAENETEAEKEKKAREQAEERATKAEEKAQAAQALADERAVKAELKVQLLGEGARKDRLAKILKDADLSETTLEDEEVKNLEPVVKWAKEEYPEWFGTRRAEIPTTPDGSGQTATPKGAAKAYMDRKYGAAS